MKSKSILHFSAFAIAITSSAHAQVVNIDNQTFHYGTLLTDNFNTPSYNWWEFNNSIAADQGGTLAALPYSTSNGNGYTAQHSNGGYMLLTSDGWGGYGGMASPNHNFATTANTTNKPLEIQFDMWSVAGDAPDWIGFGLNGGQGQLFYEGVYGFAATVGDGVHNYKFVISDAAGTGSGFNGITDGAKIDSYRDNVFLQTITETLGTGDGYITFRTIPSAWTGWNIGHVDNLKITSGQLTNPLATNTELNLSNNGSLNFGDVTQTVAKLDGTAGTTIKLVNTSLTVDGSVNSTFAGVISGIGGSLIKSGSSTLTLSGANTYSGPTTVTSGILSLGNGTSSSNLNDSAAVTVGQVPASGAKIDLNFTGLEIVGSVTLDGTNAGTGFFDATSHPTYFTGTGQLFVAGGVIADNNGTWTSSNDGYWEDAGNWASNTIASGVDKTATFNGALGTSVSLLSNITIGNLNFSGEDYTITGAALTLDAVTTPAISVAAGRTATITSNVAGSFGMEKTGDGTLLFTGVKTYTGGTTVTGGTLELSGGSGGNSIIRDALTVNSGATVSLTNDDGTGLGYNGGAKVTSLTINGGTVTTAGVMHVWNLGGGITMTGGTLQSNNGTSDPTGPQMEWINSDVTTLASADTATIGGRIRMRADGGAPGITFTVADGAAGNDLLVSAAVTEASGGRSITKNGPGRMVFSGANSYTGTTTVNEGVLQLNSATLSDVAPVVLAFGSKLNLNFVGNDTVGSLVIDGNTLSSGSYNSTHPLYGTYFEGTGTLVVGAPGPQIGGTWISSVDGSWSDSANWQSGNVANGTDNLATFNPGAPVTATVDGNRFIGGLSFTGSDTSLAGSDVLTLDRSDFVQPVVTVASGITATLATNIGGSLGLEKKGPGNLKLTGAKSYSGGTVVSEGTLELSGATGGNAQIHGSVLVNAGATLSFTNGDGTGFGFFNNPVTSIVVDGGTINPVSGTHLGFGPFMNLTLDNGGTLSGSWQWNGDGLLAFSSFGDNTNTIGGNVVLRSDAGSNHSFTVNDGASATDLAVSANLSDQWPEYPSVPASSLTKTGPGTMVLSGSNSYDGSTLVQDGVLEVAPAGSLRFRPTTNASSNSVSGSATAALSFLGTISLDLGAADATVGNSWNLFNLASFTGPTPTLQPGAVTSTTLGSFTEVSPGVWELPVTGAKWVFTEANGNLAYASAATDYDTWKSANGVTGGPNDDDDNDGLSNNEEYAFGLDPTGGASVNPIAVPLDKTAGTFSYTRRQQSLTGLTYTVWVSTDLVSWNQDNGAVQGTPSLSGEVETVPVTLSSGLLTNPKLFIQVRAQ